MVDIGIYLTETFTGKLRLRTKISLFWTCYNVVSFIHTEIEAFDIFFPFFIYLNRERANAWNSFDFPFISVNILGNYYLSIRTDVEIWRARTWKKQVSQLIKEFKCIYTEEGFFAKLIFKYFDFFLIFITRNERQESERPNKTTKIDIKRTEPWTHA